MSKKPTKVSKPLSFAIFPTLMDGSIPIDFTFNFLRGFNKIPSLDPISTTKLYFLIFKQDPQNVLLIFY